MSAILDNDGRPEGLVTASEIAQMAGVSPSAVSNWRKRFDDFPRPAGTAHTGGDLFRVEDVDRWLNTRRPRRKPEPGPAEQLWAVTDRLRGRARRTEGATLVVIAAALLETARQAGLTDRLIQRAETVVEWARVTADRIEAERPELASLFDPLFDLDPDTLRLLLDTLDELEDREKLVAAVETTLSRGLADEFTTPRALADLVTELAEPYETVFDPAAGSGGFLLRAADHIANSRLCGQELDEGMWRTARARLLLHGLEADVALGDSFTQDAFAGRRFDVVIADPPWGQKSAELEHLTGDRRWQLLGMFESPPPRALEFAWLAHVIDHLAPGGRAYVSLPPGSLFRGGVEARLRAELLRRGTVEAIVTLPGVGSEKANRPVGLWIVRTESAAPDDVLLVAADGESTTLTHEVHSRIVDALTKWRTNRAAFEPTPGFANNVPVLDLLAREASLVPSRWVFEPSALSAGKLVSTVRDAQVALDQARASSEPMLPEVELVALPEARPRLRVRDLLDEGLVTLIRPRRLNTDEYTEAGIPVWLPADIHAPGEKTPEPHFVTPDQINPRFLTQPGDIVFTTVGNLRTRVDAEGGHVLGTSLHALRVRPGTFDPRAVAQLLMSEPNRRLLRGTTIPRVDVPELEIPRLDPGEAERISHFLEALDRQIERANTLVHRASELRQAVIDALATGAAGLRRAEDEPND